MVTQSKRPSTYLSKSLFLRGLQCHKSLYLHKYCLDLRDEITDAQEALFQSGIEAGLYAQKLFPNGVEIPFEDVSLSEQVNLTMREIEKGSERLYEAAFRHDDVFVKVDILCKGEQGWEIYEVKASSGVKDVHLDDVALQYYVLTGFGLAVSKACIVHINTDYVRYGEIEVDKLFAIQDLTDVVMEKQGLVEESIKEMKTMLRGDMPLIDIGHHCDDPYPCDFHGHCWQHIPEDSVFKLRGRGPDPYELYRQGIVYLRDIPRHLLSEQQEIQVESFLNKRNIFNKTGVKEFLDSLWYPLYFLDFETTFMVSIPLFDGTRPYQNIPFQYSLHCLEKENENLTHYEYLASPDTDPRRELAEKLLQEIPKNSCVLAYNKSFEARVLNDLKGWFPEYTDKIENIINNLRDLMIPFRKKDVYSWQMEGSYSLKDVLPAIVPQLGYKGMEISDGAMAGNAYLRMRQLEDAAEMDRLRTALLEYCKLDTLGMVKIVEKLRQQCYGALR
ncbi:MAG: DUF2779 domain-containing protein [Deltaproteobacteria bacterium]|nr:DUF2779 domain-containing protein [Deltaproteobacteria bacterium]